MNALLEIKTRQQRLVAESAAQRAALAEAWHGLETPFNRGKQMAGRAASKLRNPWLWVGIGLLALKLPIRKFSRIPILLYKGWRMARQVHAIIR